MHAAGAPDFVAAYTNRVYALIRDGHADAVSPNVETILGRKPGELKRVLETSFAPEVEGNRK